MGENPYQATEVPLASPHRPADVKYLSAVYLGWIAVVLVATIVALVTGELEEIVRQSMLAAGVAESNLQHGALGLFIVFGIAFAVVMIAIGGLFVWAANRGHLWGRLLLSLFCAYQIWEGVSAHIMMSGTYGMPVRWYDWVLNALALASLAYVGIAPHVPVLRRVQ